MSPISNSNFGKYKLLEIYSRLLGAFPAPEHNVMRYLGSFVRLLISHDSEERTGARNNPPTV